MPRLKKEYSFIDSFDKFDFGAIKLDQEKQKVDKKNIPSEIKKQAKV